MLALALKEDYEYDRQECVRIEFYGALCVYCGTKVKLNYDMKRISGNDTGKVTIPNRKEVTIKL